MPDARRLGTDAEDRAADYLISVGYTIVTRRFKARHGELDIVALDGDQLVFVEVKERLTGMSPEESIGDSKWQRVARAANQYRIETEQLDRKYRYDVVAIDRSGMRHHKGVLEA
jgi:putative endonuclease